MSYSIQDNYSVLNNYSYENKSPLFSALDWLSTPSRRVLGGRNISVLSQSYGNQMSTAGKVATVFFSILFFPVAVISMTALAMKVATLPFIWEKKIIQVQSQQTWDQIRLFNQKCQDNEYDKAIAIIKQRPELTKREDIDANLFKMINAKINTHCSWEEIKPLLSYLATQDAINLIDHAVKIRLQHQFQNDCYLTKGDELTQFVKGSFNNITVLNTCVIKLLSSALKVDVREDILLSALKMSLADHLIRFLIKMKAHTSDNLAQTLAQAEETLLRYEIFDKEQHYFTYYAIFTSPDEMKEVNTIFKDICTINQSHAQILHNLSQFSTTRFATLEELNKNLISEFKRFKNYLKESITRPNENEKKYIEAVQNMFRTMIDFIDLIFKATSDQEIESLAQKIPTTLSERTETFKNLLNSHTEFEASFSSNKDQFLATLRLKRIACLFTSTESLRSFLINYLARMGREEQKVS